MRILLLIALLIATSPRLHAEDPADERIALDSAFPVANAGKRFAGELILVEHVNRRGILRLDRDGTINKYYWDLPHHFQMLPYAEITYHGAGAELGDLPLGTHQVSGHSDTMDAPAQSVEVVKRTPASVTLVATATTGTLEISIAEGKGIIYVDDKVAGEGKASTALPVGPHKVRVTREGYLNAERAVDVKAGSTVSLGIELERIKPTGPPPPDYDNAEGIYGGLSFAGLLQANPTGNQIQRRCQDFGPGASCTSDTEKGGGLFGFVGYTWRYFGVDLLFGGSGDVSHPSFSVPNGASGAWDVSRIGGLGALRVRTSVQTRVVRASLALGLGVSERVVGISGSSTDYTSLTGLFDASVALRTSPTTAIALGCMGLWEDAGQGAVVVVSQSSTPFYLFSGPQYLIQPYLGLQFGP